MYNKNPQQKMNDPININSSINKDDKTQIAALKKEVKMLKYGFCAGLVLLVAIFALGIAIWINVRTTNNQMNANQANI